jgi:hypothetical protein
MNNNCKCLLITSSVSFITGLFFAYNKFKQLKQLVNSIEKKLRYIEHAMHINDNYQIHHDKHHLLLSERISKLEKEKEKERLTIMPQNLTSEIANELESEYIQEFDNHDSTTHTNPVISTNSSNNLLDATKKLIFG